ncbi:MAG: hypothetical protein ACJ77K_06145 [Bacteroidia bacterium]
MKKIFTLLTLVAVSYTINAQEKKADDNNCYAKWAQKFEDRGADDVPDGSYSDVIITVRSGADAECYSGKCDVKDGKVIAMYLKMEDGSYELIKKKPRYDNVPLVITNGMSSPFLTMDSELINVLFVKKIKPKKAGFVKAAEPTDD